jgi:hypothetical protein
MSRAGVAGGYLWASTAAVAVIMTRVRMVR